VRLLTAGLIEVLAQRFLDVWQRADAARSDYPAPLVHGDRAWAGCLVRRHHGYRERVPSRRRSRARAASPPAGPRRTDFARGPSGRYDV